MLKHNVSTRLVKLWCCKHVYEPFKEVSSVVVSMCFVSILLKSMIQRSKHLAARFVLNIYIYIHIYMYPESPKTINLLVFPRKTIV